ncbi:MAG: uracil phosphoribosyltransferase [Bacteroidota bacterium]
MVHNLAEQNSVFNQFIAEIRDENIQKDSMRFRRNMERTGEIFAYEISKTFEYLQKEVVTPLGIANVSLPVVRPVLATILRAGLPLHQGMLNYFDNAQNAFISAYRKYEKDGHFDIKLEYVSCPDLEDKTLIICDPMLATGASVELTYKALIKFGRPSHTHIVTLIACKDGVSYLQKKLNFKDITLWAGAIDDELTVKSYIVPGLGDAGDLAFGTKE